MSVLGVRGFSWSGDGDGNTWGVRGGWNRRVGWGWWGLRGLGVYVVELSVESGRVGLVVVCWRGCGGRLGGCAVACFLCLWVGWMGVRGALLDTKHG